MTKRILWAFVSLVIVPSFILLLPQKTFAQSTTRTEERLRELSIRQNEMTIKMQQKAEGTRTKNMDALLKLEKLSELNAKNQEKLNKAQEKVSRMNDKLQAMADKNREKLDKARELSTKSLETQKKLSDMSAKAAQNQMRVGTQTELFQKSLYKMSDFNLRAVKDQMRLGTVTEMLGKNLEKMSDINLKFMNKQMRLGTTTDQLTRIQSRLRDLSDRIAQRQMNMGSRLQTLSEMSKVTHTPSTADMRNITDRSSLKMEKIRSTQERLKEILRVYE